MQNTAPGGNKVWKASYLAPLRRRRGILRCTGRSVSLNLVQLITQERFAPEAQNLVGR